MRCEAGCTQTPIEKGTQKTPNEKEGTKQPGAANPATPAGNIETTKITRRPPREGRGDTTTPNPVGNPRKPNHHKTLPIQTQDGLHLPLIERTGISRTLSQEPLPS
jgi:hypothetical protein